MKNRDCSLSTVFLVLITSGRRLSITKLFLPPIIFGLLLKRTISHFMICFLFRYMVSAPIAQNRTITSTPEASSTTSTSLASPATSTSLRGQSSGPGKHLDENYFGQYFVHFVKYYWYPVSI